MNNLIGNAVKFSHQRTRVHVSLIEGPASVTVAVRDQGQGIPASDLPKLFKPFSRAPASGWPSSVTSSKGMAGRSSSKAK